MVESFSQCKPDKESWSEKPLENQQQPHASVHINLLSIYGWHRHGGKDASAFEALLGPTI